MPVAGAHAQLHSKFLDENPLQSVELIGVFFHTQVGDFPSSELAVTAPLFTEVMFL